MSTICFYAQYTKSKVGVNSLTVTWDIEQVTRSDGTRSALVTGGANSVTVGRRGLYGYVLTGADLTLYDYVATAITADSTVDQQEIAALWTLYSLSWHDILTSALTAANSIGKAISDFLTAYTAHFAGITSLAKWLRGLYRKDAMDATAKSEVNTGGGAFDETSDSLEANRDNIGTNGASLTVTAGTVSDKSGYELSATGIDSIIDEVIEGTTTFRQMMRLIASVLFGKSSGGGTTNPKFRDLADTKDRIDATVDVSGNRSSVTRDAT